MPAPHSIRLAVVALAGVLAAPMAQAGTFPTVPVDANCLPPSATHGLYVTSGPLTYNTGLGTISLSMLSSANFSTCVAPPSSGSLAIPFTSTVSLVVSVNGGSPVSDVVTAVPDNMTVTFGGSAAGVTSYTTQLTQMNLTVPGAFMIRTDPTTPSTGGTTITNTGGNFTVSSFFDIFTDLSLDGGATWIPAQSDTNLYFTVPEPATLLVLGLSFLATGAVRRRR